MSLLFLIYRVSVNFYILAYIFRYYVVNKDFIFTFSVASTIFNASDSYNYTPNSCASIIGGSMHSKLEADHLCLARTIYALAWVVRGDQLCKHKWSARTLYARTICVLTVHVSIRLNVMSPCGFLLG